VSRRTQRSGVSGGTLTFFSLPLTRSVMSAMLSEFGNCTTWYSSSRKRQMSVPLLVVAQIFRITPRRHPERSRSSGSEGSPANRLHRPGTSLGPPARNAIVRDHSAADKLRLLRPLRLSYFSCVSFCDASCPASLAGLSFLICS
jgi:hypothetical protein